MAAKLETFHSEDVLLVRDLGRGTEGVRFGKDDCR